MTEPVEAPKAWIEALLRGTAEVARGESVPIEPVLERCRAKIARMEERQASQPKRSAGTV